MKNDRSIPVLVGHPFAPIGRGEDIRASFRAFQIARFTLPVWDIFTLNDPDPDIERELTGHLIKELSESINIFFINGDEIANVLSRLRDELPSGAYNILYPAWELSIYPREWADQVECFDEVWAQSRFAYESLRQAVSKPVFSMPLASQVEVSTFLSRRYFGITESSYVFLFFFDFTSYIDRKNPFAVLRAFEKVCSERHGEDVRFVIKMGGSVYKQEDYRRFMEQLEEFKYRDKVIVVNKTLSNNEIKNLVRCCDCFVSLHRSEGFGRGMAEAMCLGKPVIATGYSGNLDFMNEENSCLVRYKLVHVMEGQYPHARGQVWAEPDIDHAAEYMLELLSDRDFGRRLGAVASRYMRQFFSYRAIGLRYRERVKEILNNKPCPKHKIKERKSSQIDGPVIVYNMAKVGSRSVYETLTDLDLGIPIYHAHVLHDLENMAESLTKQLSNPVNSLAVVRQGMELRRLIYSDRNQKWNLVSLVRDPIARNVSRFFHGIEEVIPDIRQQLDAFSIGSDDLIHAFLNKWEHVSALNWFDTQFKPVFDIDVYSRPFPREKGYDIYREGRFSLLLIRLEDLDIHAEQAIEEFLGIPDFKLKRSNVGAEKWYKDIYREFLSKITLSDEYIDQIYNSKFVQHFYSRDEIEAFRARWIHKNG